ncbi:MAG: hypothetical protein KGH69_05565, partial [Candidatus Micrarchaeota archaeon]|nr:hypothetical protein [Candidatus Micrarchaeota archaeon]
MNNVHRLKLQGAMEYLMTYGWAILIVAVVLAVMFSLGVFSSGGTVSNSCLSTAGYLCQNPVLNSTGWLGIKFGWIGAFPITLTNIACTIGNAAPVSTQSVNVQLQSGSTVNLAFLCPLVSNGIGS